MLPGTKSILVGKKNANEYVIKLLDPETMKKVLEESEVVHSQMNDPAIKFVPSVPSINTELPTGFESFMIVAPESNK